MICPAKLSVVVPIYNRGNYLFRCLDSIYNQSIKDIQVILVNDGSIDKSTNIALRTASQLPNLTVINHGKNLGTGVARNTGLARSESMFITFLDSDDWVDTNAYQEMITALEYSLADIALCGIKTEYGSPLLSTVRYHYTYNNVITGRFALRLLCRTEKQDIPISPMVGNKVFRSQFLKQNNLSFPQRSLYEDDEFMFMALYNAKNVVLVPNVNQHYFQHELSTSHTFSKKYIDAFLETFQNIRDYLSKQGDFSDYSVEYYAFFDKCMSSLLDTLFR